MGNSFKEMTLERYLELRKQRPFYYLAVSNFIRMCLENTNS
jgi:hypothetical protein